ncbi:hypothetical protein L3V83_07585 [Thiotrichales bacterium 19X7-9]|nr:hypothetical protein [Thiotrichales bacterium 19X7-9]
MPGINSKIRVVSLDMDHCIFNTSYVTAYNDESGNQKDKKSLVIDCNRSLFNSILEKIDENKEEAKRDEENENDNNTQLIFTVGSNRQSKSIDQYNMISRHGKTESAYTAIDTIVQHFKNSHKPTTLNKLLLEDIFTNKKAGDSFKSAIESLYQKKLTDSDDNNSWLLDGSKVPILYAQMHDIAASHLESKIEFDFYDDDSRDEIIPALTKFYSQFPQMIPDNVILNLHKYKGNNPELKYSIKGQGKIDTDYRQTVKNMMEITLDQCKNKYQCTGDDAKIFISSNMHDSCAAYVTPELFKEKLTKQNTKLTKDYIEAISYITGDVEIDKDKLEKNVRQLISDGKRDNIHQVINNKESLKTIKDQAIDLDNYINKPFRPKKIAKACILAIGAIGFTALGGMAIAASFGLLSIPVLAGLAAYSTAALSHLGLSSAAAAAITTGAVGSISLTAGLASTYKLFSTKKSKKNATTSLIEDTKERLNRYMYNGDMQAFENYSEHNQKHIAGLEKNRTTWQKVKTFITTVSSCGTALLYGTGQALKDATQKTPMNSFLFLNSHTNSGQKANKIQIATAKLGDTNNNQFHNENKDIATVMDKVRSIDPKSRHFRVDVDKNLLYRGRLPDTKNPNDFIPLRLEHQRHGKIDPDGVRRVDVFVCKKMLKYLKSQKDLGAKVSITSTGGWVGNDITHKLAHVGVVDGFNYNLEIDGFDNKETLNERSTWKAGLFQKYRVLGDKNNDGTYNIMLDDQRHQRIGFEHSINATAFGMG